MDIRSDLLKDIDAYIAQRGIAETTFGRIVVNDGKFVGRLRAGGNVTLDTIDRVNAFLASEAAPAPVNAA